MSSIASRAVASSASKERRSARISASWRAARSRPRCRAGSARGQDQKRGGGRQMLGEQVDLFVANKWSG